ncbi:MAG: YkgJ family cysteine cluster protein [Candidatus Choladocola sp.]|nr:YkgJ family cysteine cluster protein [Candidatus Choladocola sp.]
MKRQVSLEEISDGKLYGRNDMVKAGCGGCRGCSDCCSGMGNSVILDPYDIFRLTGGLSVSFEELMAGKIELNVVDGVILPNLSMSSRTETCAFLNEAGRCSIHPFRPGVCRLFPLGRYYEKEKRSFRYFLQIRECPAPNKTKVKVEKWVDTPGIVRYEQFVNTWHYFLEDVQEKIAQTETDESIKNINLYLLKLFYIRPYDTGKDFYEQFEERLSNAKEVLAI